MQVGPKCHPVYSYRRGVEENLLKKRGTAVTEAETGVLQPQVKERRLLPEAGRGDNRFSARAPGESMFMPTHWLWLNETDFQLLAFRSVRELTSVVLSHQTCGNLLQPSLEISTQCYRITIMKPHVLRYSWKRQNDYVHHSPDFKDNYYATYLKTSLYK